MEQKLRDQALAWSFSLILLIPKYFYLVDTSDLF